MRGYLARKTLVYGLTFVVAVTLNWLIPRLMPGDPVQRMVARAAVQHPETIASMTDYYERTFGLDLPIWQQYLNYWGALFRGDLGTSVWLFPTPVSEVVLAAVPYTLGIMIPAILLSFVIGNTVGAMAARSRWLDNVALPVGYLVTAMPYMWLAILLAWGLGVALGWFPVAGGYDFGLVPQWSWSSRVCLHRHRGRRDCGEK
jgi:peptide/nickel transport system permease protein